MTQITKEEWEKGKRPTYGKPPERLKKTTAKQPDSEEE